MRAPRRPRTQARMYDRSRDLGSLPVTTTRCAVVAEAKAGADQRMNGGEESDSAIVVMKPTNKAWCATWRSWRSEGPGATGDAKERPCSEHRVGKPLGGSDAGPERSGTAVPEGCRHNRSEEPDALARTSGSARGPSGNRRATATCHVAELAERRAGRNGRREGKARLRTQSREAPRWVRCWTGTERHGSSRGVPSQPERGAGCVSAHVRICAGPVG